MSIISFGFFLFVAVTLLLYYIIPVHFRWLVLLVASVFFFIEGCSVKLFALMLCMSMFAWLCGLSIGKVIEHMKSISKGDDYDKKLANRRNLITIIGVAVEVIILVVLKDNSFFIVNTEKLSSFLGYPINISIPSWAAPLGVSYYTLILIAYILDISWETSQPQKNPLKFLLFSCYFPQIISGPFTRYHKMENQLFAGRLFNYEHFCFGTQRLIWGLFKKLVIAERLSILVGTIYGDYSTYAGTYVFVAVIGYTLQVYMDFSGCMDIVIGVSEMFGIILPENFRTPFFATSLSEIWRRWHMTLGLYVKDYVLYPVLKSELLQKIGSFYRKRLGKQAGKRIPTYIGMFITWFVVGFWHGGSWKYIFGSGLFFFIMIVGGQLLEPLFEKLVRVLKINTECFSWTLYQRIRTFLLFAASVSFGRAISLTDGLNMWKAAFSTWNPWALFSQSLFSLGLDRQNFYIMVVSLLIVFVVSIMQQTGSVREKLARQNIVFRWGLLLFLFFSVLLTGMYGYGYDASKFIYFQF